jgi:hypothetical protein
VDFAHSVNHFALEEQEDVNQYVVFLAVVVVGQLVVLVVVELEEWVLEEVVWEWEQQQQDMVALVMKCSIIVVDVVVIIDICDLNLLLSNNTFCN